MGTPEIYYRYISSQLSWIKKLVCWDDIKVELLPQWVIPFQILLEKYELPKSKIVLSMGSTMISYISDLCLKENLLEMYEVLLVLLRSKRNLENKLMIRLKTETDQNSILKYYINSMSYLGEIPWKKPNRGEGGKRGRPPDLLNSQFIENIVNNKLDIVGNVVSGGEICPEFKNKLQKLGGFSEELYKQVLKMLSKRLEYLKKGGFLQM